MKCSIDTSIALNFIIVEFGLFPLFQGYVLHAQVPKRDLFQLPLQFTPYRYHAHPQGSKLSIFPSIIDTAFHSTNRTRRKRSKYWNAANRIALQRTENRFLQGHYFPEYGEDALNPGFSPYAPTRLRRTHTTTNS